MVKGSVTNLKLFQESITSNSEKLYEANPSIYLNQWNPWLVKSEMELRKIQLNPLQLLNDQQAAFENLKYADCEHKCVCITRHTWPAWFCRINRQFFWKMLFIIEIQLFIEFKYFKE